MELFAKLWIAIPVAALAVWFWSFLSWGLVRLHCNDFKATPSDDATMQAVANLKLAPGTYAFPYAKRGHERDPAFLERWQRGPIGLLSVWRPVNMGLNLALTLLTFLVASTLIGYLLAAALPAGIGFAKVMQVGGTAGILAYTVAQIPGMIWFQASRPALLMGIVDGIAMGLATGAVFAALWPKV